MLQLFHFLICRGTAVFPAGSLGTDLPGAGQMISLRWRQTTEKITSEPRPAVQHQPIGLFHRRLHLVLFNQLSQAGLRTHLLH